MKKAISLHDLQYVRRIKFVKGNVYSYKELPGGDFHVFSDVSDENSFILYPKKLFPKYFEPVDIKIDNSWMESFKQ